MGLGHEIHGRAYPFVSVVADLWGLPRVLFQKLASHGLKERILLRKGDRHFIGMPTSYRWVDEAVFGTVPYSVYGDRLSIITWGPPVRMVIVRNASIAENFRRQFELNWAQAHIPPFAKIALEKPQLNRPRHELNAYELQALEEEA